MTDVKPNNVQTDNVVERLRKFFASANKNQDDKTLTRTEARNYLDTNKDGFVSSDEAHKENDDLVRRIIGLDLDGVQIDNKDDLKQAQAVLKLITNEIDRNPPPGRIQADDELMDSDLIRNPQIEGIDPTFTQKLSNERVKFSSKEVEMKKDEATKIVTSAIEKLKATKSDATVEERADAVVKEILENTDSTGGRTLRMQELYGVMKYAETDKDFQDAFLKSMIKYVNGESNENQKSFLTSLLALRNMSDLEHGAEANNLKTLLDDLIKKVASEGTAFKDIEKNKEIAYFDGTEDAIKGGDFGSILLLKNDKGEIEFRVTEEPNVFHLTRYIFEDEKLGDKATPGAPEEDVKTPPPLGGAPGTTDAETPQGAESKQVPPPRKSNEEPPAALPGTTEGKAKTTEPEVTISDFPKPDFKFLKRPDLPKYKKGQTKENLDEIAKYGERLNKYYSELYSLTNEKIGSHLEEVKKWIEVNGDKLNDEQIKIVEEYIQRLQAYFKLIEEGVKIDNKIFEDIKGLSKGLKKRKKTSPNPKL